MSVQAILARVAAIEQAIADPASLLGAGSTTGGTAAPGAAESATRGEPSFAQALQSASTRASPTQSTSAQMLPTQSALQTQSSSEQVLAPRSANAIGVNALAPTSASLRESPGQRIVRIAESQIGQTEEPPGSNESPAIAMYRTATAGAIPGAPWCAYFASWAARQAGEPLGANGEGLGSVAQVWSWAESSGRAIPNGPGVIPQPGDLIVFGDEHVGIVRDVLPNGDIQTIEGNYENKVSTNVRAPTEATGYVNVN
jgi:CHAP domain